MPLLTVVLVVHREQGWLPELAESVLAQEGDWELLAIDDASPDHAPEMLDALAERDSRVRVRHLMSRAGLGAARNLALGGAEGKYLWFVHTTDLLPTGAVAAVSERLASGQVELLLLSHSIGDMFGGTRPGPHGHGVGAFDKIFDASYVRERGLRFGPGAYSELTVTWPALLTAERIAGLAEPVYVRREPPNAVSEGSPFDVFAQYDAVLALDIPKDRRRLVPPAMLRHELSMLARLPDHERARFFQAMSEGYRRHRTRDDVPLGSRGLELRARLAERGDYRAYRLFEGSLAARRALAPGRVRLAAKRRGRRALQLRSGALRRRYEGQLRRPVDPNLAVFAAYWYRGYSCNPRAIYERAREIVPDVRGVWVVNTEGAGSIPDGVDYVMAGTPEYFDLIARAKWFVNNVNFPNNLVKREGTVHVMTHHGTPLKRMGLDLRITPDGGERAGLPGLLRRCSRWDYSVSQNAFTTPIWERVYPTRYESLEVGYPRNDVLATAGAADVERIRAELGIPDGRRVALYAPTHREYHEEFVPMLDLAALARRLGDDWLLLARAHYFYGGLDLGAGGAVMDVSGHPSIEALCIASDALVTDYSSIMFDYAVLDRPIVIHAPDWEEYRDKRGTYFDLMAEPPGPVSRTEAELAEALLAGDAAPDLRSAFRARFCSLDDGRAAERVVRRVWLGESIESLTRETAVAATQ